MQLVAPVVLTKVPAAQELQDIDPVDDVYDPVPHFKQADIPNGVLVLDDVPTGHARQVAPATYVPAPHNGR